MKQRNRKTKLYRTDNLFVYETGNSTLAIEGVIDGKRIRQRAKSLDEAKSKCHSLEEGKREEMIARTILDTKQLREAERVFGALPEGVSLSNVLEAFLSNYTATSTPIKDVVWTYLETKENRSYHTYRQVKGILFKFASFAGYCDIDEITCERVLGYLKRVGEASFNNHLRAIKGLYIWALNEGVAKDNPCANIKLRTRARAEVSVLSPAEVNELLGASQRLYGGELLPYVAITLFAGLRPDSEMKHLTWESINLEDAEIRVVKGKTRIPRTVEMPSNLLQWLLVCDRTRPIYPTNFRRKWAAVRHAAGFKGGIANTDKQKEAEAERKPWPKDHARHSAISYKVRQSGDINTTATWAGNSPAIIRTHYLGLVSKSQTAEFYTITPSGQKLAAG